MKAELLTEMFFLLFIGTEAKGITMEDILLALVACCLLWVCIDLGQAWIDRGNKARHAHPAYQRMKDDVHANSQ